MQMCIRDRFNKAEGILIGTALGGGEQDPGIKQTGENSVCLLYTSIAALIQDNFSTRRHPQILQHLSLIHI